MAPPLTNAQRQARWRERNVVVLTADARDIAARLIAMEETKLRKVAAVVNGHLKRPRRRDTDKTMRGCPTYPQTRRSREHYKGVSE